MNDKRVPKFKIGDKVVCIDTSYGKNVTIGKIYEVGYATYNFLNIYNDLNKYMAYRTNCFLLLKDYRRSKLKEILSRI